MPGFLLHQGATVVCLHVGQAEPMATVPIVKVGGMAVAVQPVPYMVAGCILPPPPAANGPCVTAQWLSAALRVKVGGLAVLLADSQAICAPSGTGLLVMVTQIRVKGM